jgi:hypothetical protein
MTTAALRLVPSASWIMRHLVVYFAVAGFTGAAFVAGSYVYSRVTPAPAPAPAVEPVSPEPRFECSEKSRTGCFVYRPSPPKTNGYQPY